MRIKETLSTVDLIYNKAHFVHCYYLQILTTEQTPLHTVLINRLHEVSLTLHLTI